MDRQTADAAESQLALPLFEDGVAPNNRPPFGLSLRRRSQPLLDRLQQTRVRRPVVLANAQPADEHPG